MMTESLNFRMSDVSASIFLNRLCGNSISAMTVSYTHLGMTDEMIDYMAKVIKEAIQ